MPYNESMTFSNETSYWRKQTASKPLFPDVEWNRPQQKSRAGKLAIIGGSPSGFAATAENYQTALSTGAGRVKVFMPNSLKKVIPPVMTDVILMASNPSGGFSQDGLSELSAGVSWSDVVLFIGDAGRNSETTIVYEHVIKIHQTPIVITRDAVDLLKNTPNILLERQNTTLVVSFAQLRSLLQAVYYPKMLNLSMPLLQFIDAIHKVTLTYPSTLVTFFNDQLIVAHDGEVVTTTWTNPMALWRGEVATKAACYLLWTPRQALQAISTSMI